MPAPREEDFAPTSGRLLGILGLLVIVAAVASGVLDPRARLAPWGYALAAWLATAIWVALLRPRVWIEPGVLVLRGLLRTVRVPLAAVESVVVRQVLVVVADGRRWTCPAVGRSRRTLVSADRGLLGDAGSGASRVARRPWSPGVGPADLVLSRIEERVDRARGDARSPGTADQQALADGVRQEWAWPETGLLVGLALLTALLVLLG